MPALVKKYPVYVPDEPISYKNFIGGINSDQSNEHLTEVEIRDGLNVHFQSGGLVKRKGAKILSKLISDVTLNNIQGVFLYTYRITYVIIAADGKLFYGTYSPNAEIKINPLPILFYDINEVIINNPQNMKLGLPIYDETNIDSIPLNHRGYVFNKPFTVNGIARNFVGEFNYLPEGFTIRVNDYVLLENNYYLRLNDNYLLNFIKPTNTQFWSTLTNQELTEIENESIVTWNENKILYKVNEVVYYNQVAYKCIRQHYVRNNNNITDSSDFENIEKPLAEFTYQNQNNIEGSTYKNILYLATGTRIVEVYINENNLLVARVMLPKLIDAYVAKEVGLNQLSPFPENCLSTFEDQVITSVSNVVVYHRIINDENSFELKPILTLAAGDNINDYYFRWEKLINGVWYVVKRFRDNFANVFVYDENGIIVPFKEKFNSSYLIVDDADQYQYRVTIAKSFSIIESPTETTEIVYELESLKTYNKPDSFDLKVNKIIGDFFGQATSVIYRPKVFNDELNSNTAQPSLYQVINSCKKVFADGNKFLYYNDSYSSGEWFKSIIDNPNFIALRGGLSFKTNKNEELLKVISFAGNIIAFANAENIGGSIHIILGNGDDVESDQYYSPYRRKTISPEISTDNANSVQVAENLLFFKHFDNIYFIQAGELDNERVTLYSANDKIKFPNKNFVIPWNDNSCISEVTEDHYSLLWPEQVIVENNEVFKVREALRIKLYFKFYQNIMGKVYFSWLRDEGKVFNTQHILYVNKKPIYLYNNSLVTLHDNTTWTDFDEVYPCKIIFRSYDLDKPKMYKLLDNLTLFYNRNQYYDTGLWVKAFNEAGHTILEYNNENLIQNLKTLRVGDQLNNTTLKLDSTLIDTKVINTKYKFPFLSTQVEVRNETKGEFSFGSITFNYTTVDIPDQNPYAIYADAIRKDDSFLVLPNRRSNAYVTPEEKVPEQKLVVNVPTVDSTLPQTQPLFIGKRIFVQEDTPFEARNNDLWYHIDE
jgi:hypothetical protein